MFRRAAPVAVVAACLLAAACSGGTKKVTTAATTTAPPASGVANGAGATDTPSASGASAPPPSYLEPGPPNIYAATGANMLADSVKDIPTRVYVPLSEGDRVQVIDPATFQIIDSYPVGHQPQHVTPSWDMQTLYVDNTASNSLTPINPRTGKPGPNIDVTDPYNLYFTPDGKSAVVMAERFSRLNIRDPKTWSLKKSIAINHSGPNHADFSLDGRYMWVSCEFSGWLVKVDLQQGKEIAELNLGGAPIDVKFSPDMSVLYVANQDRGGVSVVDPNTMQELEFIDTGAGAHGLYPSRDASVLYVSNRQGGSISLISFATRKVVATWKIPGGGSPDMGSVSADGKQLWLAGRFSDEVYVFDTTNGNLLARIKTGRSPHGLTLVPQPGRFSLGHTGNYR